jgi:hypothetical protein
MSGSLTEREVQALREALDDEYRAHATYDQVIQDFGPVRPFVIIRDAEARHIAALTRLFEHYGLELPDNRWPGRVKRNATLDEACRAAIDAEITNAALYQRLLASTDRPDILSVYGALQSASQRNHLPAFQRCEQRGHSQGRINLRRHAATSSSGRRRYHVPCR